MLARDDLTGILDRPSLLQQLETAARESDYLVAIFMDLDNLMRFNEQFGHVAGDEWIKGAVALFAEAFGEDGLVGRYGGDEFIAALRSRDINAAFDRAEQLRLKIEKDGPEVTIAGQPTRTGYTVSFGLADYPHNASDAIDLIEKAKLALYRAKEAGGNQVCTYEEKDSLTGLLNYAGGQRAIEEALLAAREKRQPLSLIMIDIDRFKELNDEFGHRAGDEVLKRLARILSEVFKSRAILTRSGGDEFTVVLPGEHPDSAFLEADEIRRQAEASAIQIRLADQSLTLRFEVTGGIASYPADASDRVDLQRKADEALYRAKQTGRNRICLPASSQMVTKTSHYTQIQLERLSVVARKLDKSEAFLLREALDELLRKYDEAA